MTRTRAFLALVALLVLIQGGRAQPPQEGLIAFVRADPTRPELGGPLYVVRPDGGGLRELIALDVQHPDWSPDGRSIAFSHRCAIWVARADGSDLRRVTGGTTCATTPSWSPDGRRIAFSDVFRRVGVRVSAVIATVNANGSRLQYVSRVNDGLFIEDAAPTWAAGGGRITFQRSSVYPEGFRHLPRNYVVSQIAVVAPTGHYVPGPGTSPFDVDPTADWVADSAPEWSPDGTRLVFQRTFMRSADPARSVEIVLYLKGKGGGPESIAVADAAWPDWSPDGRELVYTSLEGTGARARGTGLAIADVSGAGRRQLTSGPGDEWATWAALPD